jgi:hypothetical protein
MAKSSQANAETNEAGKAWSDEEMTRLAALVKKEGVGNWASKAATLGTGRSAGSTGSQWRRLEMMRRAGATGGVVGVSCTPTVGGFVAADVNSAAAGQPVPQRHVVYEYQKRYEHY